MDLSISEQFILLAQHPVKGRLIINGIQLQYGIAGSLLLEMSVEKRLEIKDNLVYVKTRSGKAGPMITDIETLIRGSAKPRKLKFWVNKLSRRYKHYKRTIETGLVRKKLIRIEKKKFLGLIPYQNSYLTGKRKYTELVGQLKDGLSRKRDLDDQTVVMLGLVEACKMYKIFSADPAELRQIKKTLKEIVKNSPIAGTVDKTIQGVQAAIFATIIASSVATSSASH